jgi:photosystem II stability/assembly factor-like uncharacterized protein
VNWEYFPFSETDAPAAAALAASPLNPQRLIVSMIDGEIFGSENGGTTWQRRFGVPGGPAGTGLRFDPRADSIVYAGFGSSGFWKSWDTGLHWTHIPGNLPLSLSVQSLDVDPSDSAIFLGTDQGIFKSLDGGEDWTASTGIPPGVSVTTLRSREPVVVAGTPGAGLYESDDSGATWTRVSAGPSAVTALDVSPSGIFFAGGTDSGIFVRNASGAWSSSRAGLFGTGAQFVEADENDADTVYAFLDHLAVSHDRGVTWKVSSGLDLSDYPRKFVVLDSRRMVAIAGESVFTTDDGGDSWSLVPGVADPIDLQLDPSSPGRLLLLTDGDLRASTDFAASWVSLSPPRGSGFSSFLVDRKRGGVLYVGDYSSGVLKTEDGGASWAESNSGIVPQFGQFLTAIGSDDSSLLFASDDYVGGCPDA